jgi:hypothetical protein
MITLFVLAALVAGAPIIATLLVSVASRREDAERSLTGRAPGWVTSAARHLLRVPASRLLPRRTAGVPGPRAPVSAKTTRPLARPRS